MDSLSLLQGILPNPGIEPRSPALQVDSLSTELGGKPSWQIDGKNMKTVSDFIFLSSKINVDGDCRCLLLGRITMTNLDRVLKSRDITLLTKIHIVKAMVFPVVKYGGGVVIQSLSRV